MPCGSVLQCNTGHFSTVQYNTITHIAQDNIQHSRQRSIREITKRNQTHILYVIKTQKREPKVEESLLKSTRYTEQ